MDLTTGVLVLAFVLLFAVSLWRYVKRPGPLELSVLAVFSAWVSLLVLQFLYGAAPGLEAAAIQITRTRPMVERARLNKVIAVKLDRKQTSPATTTSRQSCCVVRQDRIRYMTSLH